MAVESDLRSRIGKLLREHGYMVQSIETGAIAEGVPDLWYSIASGIVTHSGWLELKKVREMPKKRETSVFKSLNHPLSVEQENWIGMAADHGTRVDILVAFERDYFFVPGQYAPKFNSFTQADLRKFQVKKDDIPRLLLV